MTSIFHLDQSNKAPRDIRLPLDERPANGGHWREMRWSSGDMEQLQAELTRREGDLHIAAEIGTTLLEKMRTLEEENERLQSECTQFFESRDSRTHELDRQLSECADEADGRIHELEAEVEDLKLTLAKERRTYRITEQTLNQRVGSLEAENAHLHGKLKAVIEQETLGRTDRSEHATQLKELTKELEKTRRSLEHIQVEASTIAAINVKLEHDVETVSNQRDCLQEELKLKESQLLTVQQEIDDQHEQLEAEQDVIAQLRETCIRLKDEVEEKQAQDSITRTSSSDLSLMSELQECLILSPLGDYHQVLEERDKLLERNSRLGSDLSSMQNELKRVEEQLMTAVHQKLLLTQQLEEWQSDMALVVEQQISKKLSKEMRLCQIHVR